MSTTRAPPDPARFRAHRYPLTLLPGIAGLVLGGVVTAYGLGDAPVAVAYTRLPEFQVWRIIIVIQFSVYLTILAYLAVGPPETGTPRIDRSESLAVAGLTLFAILMPAALFRIEHLPLPAQSLRLNLVVAAGLAAILLLTHRLARIHRAFGEAHSIPEHIALRRETKNLLWIAALVVTLATLGSAVLQMSLAALGAAMGTEVYAPPLYPPHVVAYGAYNTLILFLFFTPVMLADRGAAIRIREQVAARKVDPEEVEAELGLDVPLTERVASLFGVLSPLIGAMVAQIVT